MGHQELHNQVIEFQFHPLMSVIDCIPKPVSLGWTVPRIKNLPPTRHVPIDNTDSRRTNLEVYPGLTRPLRQESCT